MSVPDAGAGAYAPGQMKDLRGALVATAVAAGLTLACSPSAESPLVHDFSLGLSDGWTVGGREGHDWKMEDGRLALRTPAGGIFGDHTDEEVGSAMLSLESVEQPFCVEVDVEVYPKHLYENAGLIFYGDRDNYTVVTVEYYAEYHDPPTIVRAFSEIEGELADDNVVGLAPLRPMRLRAVIDQSSVTGYYRVEGEEGWTKIGSSEPPAGGFHSMGVQVGYGGEEAGRWAFFDDFVVRQSCED